MRSLRVLAAIGWLALAPGVARATDADPLALAERAYRAVDFEAQRAEAQRALEAGSSGRARLSRIYRLLGIAHAALGANDDAKLAFMRLLALDPEVELSRLLSPRLRTPYLEARGYWDVASSRFGVEAAGSGAAASGAGGSGAAGPLALTLHDPLGMTARVQVRSAAPEPQVLWEESAAPELSVPREALAEHAGVPLAVELLDGYGNVLAVLEVGVAPAAVAPAPAPWVSAERPAAGVEPERPSLLLPLALAGTSTLALGLGLGAHIARERRADEWNGSGCEQPGSTRAQQCADVDRSRRSAEQVAILGYATGGALLAASWVTYLLSGSSERQAPAEPSLACTGGPAPLGLSCSGHF